MDWIVTYLKPSLCRNGFWCFTRRFNQDNLSTWKKYQRKLLNHWTKMQRNWDSSRLYVVLRAISILVLTFFRESYLRLQSGRQSHEHLFNGKGLCSIRTSRDSRWKDKWKSHCIIRWIVLEREWHLWTLWNI